MADLGDKVPEKSFLDEIKEKVSKKQNEDASSDSLQEFSDSAKNFEEKIESTVDEPIKPSSEENLDPSENPFADFYKSMEDKWYALLDKINEYVPIYKVIDPIEEFVPSLPLFIGLILLLLVGTIAFFFLISGGGLLTGEYSFKTIEENGTEIPFVDVQISSAGQVFNAQSDDFGEFKIGLPSSSVQIIATKTGYDDFEQGMNLVFDDVAQIVLIKQSIKYTSKTLKLYVNGELFRGTATVYFTCSNPDAVPPGPRTTTNGVISDIQVPENCGTLSFRVVSDQYQDFEGQFGSNVIQQINLEPIDRPKGRILVTVFDAETGINQTDIPLTLHKLNGNIVNTKDTIAGGIALFEDVTPDTYYISATQLPGFEDIVRSEDIEVFANQRTEIELPLTPYDGEIRKILGKLVDDETNEAVEDAIIKLIVGGTPTAPEFFSNDEGIFEITNLEDETYGLYVTHEDYVWTVFEEVQTLPLDETEPEIFELTRATSENSGDILVEVENIAGDPVPGAEVTLYSSLSEINLQVETAEDGMFLFENMPPGDYNATAEIDGFFGESPTLTLNVGETLILDITIVNTTGILIVRVIDEDTQIGIGQVQVNIRKNNAQGDLLQQLLTEDDGGTPPVEFQSGLTVVAEVFEVEGYISPVFSAPTNILENTNTIITVELRPGDLDDQEFEIEFEHLLNLDESLPDIFEESKDYLYLAEFRMTLPITVVDGRVVVKAGEGNDVSDDFTSIFGSEPVGVGVYYNCVNDEDIFDQCEPTVDVSVDPAKQVIIDIDAGPNELEAGVYNFFVFIHVDDIPDLELDETIYFALKVRPIGGQFEFDPEDGYKDYTFTINGEAPCETDNCPDLTFNMDVDLERNIEGDWVHVPATEGPEGNDLFDLDVEDVYQLKIIVENFSEEVQSDLQLQIISPTDQTHEDGYIAFGPGGEATYISPAFNLEVPGAHTEIVATVPLDITNNENSNFFGLRTTIDLLDQVQEENHVEIYFKIFDDVPEPECSEVIF